MSTNSSSEYVIEGTVKPQGNGDFRFRMTQFAHVFQKASGENLYPGTLNVKVNRLIRPKEDFRIKGQDIGEPDQDLLFEHCRINGLKAYRIRPYNLKTGDGGWGDDTLEIACEYCLKDHLGLDVGSVVKIILFRSECDL